MTKVIIWNGSHSSFQGTLYYLSERYKAWVRDNPHVKVISTMYDNGTLVVTYEEKS